MKRAVTAAVLLVGAAMAPASAQEARLELGLGVGYQFFTESVDEEETGLLVQDARFDSSWLLDGTVTFWALPWLGLRGNAAWSQPTFAHAEEGDLLSSVDGPEIAETTLWNLSGDLLLRLRRPAEGRRFLPYLAGGVGVAMLSPDDEASIAVTAAAGVEGGPESGVPFVVGFQDFLLADDTQLMFLGALGFDWRFSPRWALNVEIGDRIWDSPTYPLNLAANTLPFGDEDIGQWIHQAYATVGLHFLVGGAREEPQVVVAEPPPAQQPPPPAQREPPPPPEQPVTVCVVDPAAPGGMRVLNALYLPTGRDTVVVVNGQRVPLAQAVPDVTTGAEADWFVRGEPLAFRVGGMQVEYVTYGTSRTFAANDLVLVGTIRGLPVYANAGDVADIRAQLEELRAAATPTRSFEQLLAERTALRAEFEEINTLYVPLEPVGCVFQPLQRVQEVRKVRG